MFAASEVGGLLCFDMANIRYITATHIGPGADVRRGDVADVRHVEAQQATHLRCGELSLDPRQALLAQAVEAHALLPVDTHDAIAVKAHRAPRSIVVANVCRIIPATCSL